MKFKMYHSSIDVLDLERSLEFYKKAMGLEVIREIDTGNHERKIVYIGTPDNPACMLELNWYANRTQPYELGENSVHQGLEIHRSLVLCALQILYFQNTVHLNLLPTMHPLKCL